MSQTVESLVRRSPQRLAPDRSRTITRLFVPGRESFDHQEPRPSAILRRIMALDEDEVQRLLADVRSRFAGRHRDLDATFRRHAEQFTDRLPPDQTASPERRLLIGATYTSEYALEGAAVCNPSVVAHPDQVGIPAGSLRFVMSVRSIGEGHRSSIELREGVIDADGAATVEVPSPYAAAGTAEPALVDAGDVRAQLDRLEGDPDTADDILATLGDRFTSEELTGRLDLLVRHPAIRGQGGRTIPLLRRIAERTYQVVFAPDTPLSERVLWPAMEAESYGMEDARFVRFVDDDGAVCYLATYTAYDGTEISQQLLRTTDFATFTSAPILGPAAANKGLGIFPRRVGGRFAALCRADRTNNAIAFSQDLRHWQELHACQTPTEPWEMLQLGNCGPPIETEAGWLVLTHGVGPMRTYAIGALLLDLDDPTRIVGRLRGPLLSPAPDEQDGYVPNVVYSCGGLVHAGTLLLPYGIGDAAIGVATVPLQPLLDALVAGR